MTIAELIERLRQFPNQSAKVAVGTLSMEKGHWTMQMQDAERVDDNQLRDFPELVVIKGDGQ